MRLEGLLVGLRPSIRHSSLPLAGSCPVTTSPPVTTISTPFGALLTWSAAGVVYESGDSSIARVGRSVRHSVFPDLPSILRE